MNYLKYNKFGDYSYSLHRRSVTQNFGGHNS